MLGRHCRRSSCYPQPRRTILRRLAFRVRSSDLPIHQLPNITLPRKSLKLKVQFSGIEVAKVLGFLGCVVASDSKRVVVTGNSNFSNLCHVGRADFACKVVAGAL